MEQHDYSYPLYARLMHLGMAGFGVAAYLTGENAGNNVESTGYLLHAYLGLSLAAFVLLRVIRGFSGSGPMRFAEWSPFSRRQWVLALQDLRTLPGFQVPDRGMHEGLAGLTQVFGLIVFGWMAVTGTGLFLLGEGQESDWFEIVEEVHEVGETLIPLYLALHVGAVILHSIVGRPVWQRMWKFGKNSDQTVDDHTVDNRD